jgi:hypothetical protein
VGNVCQHLFPEFHQQGHSFGRAQILIVFPPVLVLMLEVSDKNFCRGIYFAGRVTILMFLPG